MIRKMLYGTEREGGGYTVSPKKPPEGVPYKVRWRLIAEEGRAITDGENIVTAIDLQHRKDCEGWHDCENPEVPDPAPITAAADIPMEKESAGEGESYDD